MKLPKIAFDTDLPKSCIRFTTKDAGVIARHPEVLGLDGKATVLIGQGIDADTVVFERQGADGGKKATLFHKDGPVPSKQALERFLDEALEENPHLLDTVA